MCFDLAGTALAGINGTVLASNRVESYADDLQFIVHAGKRTFEMTTLSQLMIHITIFQRYAYAAKSHVMRNRPTGWEGVVAQSSFGGAECCGCVRAIVVNGRADSLGTRGKTCTALCKIIRA